MRITLTHLPGRLEGLREALEALGHTVTHAPLIATTFVPDADLGALEGCLWWIFTSRTAIEALSALNAFGCAPEQIAVVGQASARALRDIAGLEPAFVSRVETGVELAQQLLEVGAGGPFGWPRGERALLGLKRTFEAAGQTVRDVVVYRSHERAFANLSADLVVLASPSAARAVPLETALHAQLIALGASTAEVVTMRGLRVQTCAEPSVRGVLEVIEALEQERRSNQSLHIEHQPASSQGDSKQ